jgi:RHS repeat-associated protein
VTQISKVINSQTYNIGYQYDAGSDVTQITYPSGRVVKQTYNQVGQLCQISPSATNCSAVSGYYAANFMYNAPGKLLGFNYGNGVTGTFYYSPDRVQLAYLAYSKGNSTYFSLQYSYQRNSSYSPPCSAGTTGNNGSVQCITDNVNTGRSTRYGYDPLQRLTTAKSCGSSAFPQWGLSESYDRFGNRWSQTVTAGKGPSVSLSFGANGMDSSTTNQPNGYTFDPSGNMTVEPLSPPNNMTYDGENRMTAFSGNGGAASYTYDGNGIRVVKAVSGGTTTVSIFSGPSVIAEYDNGAAPASPSREYIYNPAGGATTGLLAMISGSATTYYHQDHLSVRLTTDASGNLLSQQGALPFGESWYSNLGPGDNWIFTSYDRDSESGLDFALARYYDSRTGTFCSADPLAGSPGDPQSWNRYPYGRNDPIDITDPSGKGWLKDLLIGVGVGAAIFFAPEIVSEIQSYFPTFLEGAGAPADFVPQLVTRTAATAVTAGADVGASTGAALGPAIAGGAMSAAAAQATDQSNPQQGRGPVAPALTPAQKDCLNQNIAQINKVSNLNVTPNNLANPPYMYNGGMDFDFSVSGASASALPAARYPSSFFNALTGIGHSLHVPAPGGADPSTYGTGANGAFTFTTHMDTAYSTWHTPAGALTHWWVDVRDKGAHRKPCGGAR